MTEQHAPELTEERRGQIIQLLDTRHDNLPEPTRRDHTSPGFVHNTTVRESCPDCLTNGRTMVGCATCDGRGYTETLRDRDPYAVEKVVPYGLDIDRHQRRRERDAELARLDAQLQPPVASEADAIADANQHPWPWEIARRRMWRDFDYRALDVALDALRARHPGLSPYSSRGLCFISARMPDPIRAPAAVPGAGVARLERGAGTQRLEQRNQQIRAWAKAGMAYQWIRAQVGLSDRQVREIINRTKGHAA